MLVGELRDTVGAIGSCAIRLNTSSAVLPAAGIVSPDINRPTVLPNGKLTKTSAENVGGEIGLTKTVTLSLDGSATAKIDELKLDGPSLKSSCSILVKIVAGSVDAISVPSLLIVKAETELRASVSIPIETCFVVELKLILIPPSPAIRIISLIEAASN